MNSRPGITQPSSLLTFLRRKPLQVRRCLEEVRTLREQVKFLERQRDRALSDRAAWEAACRDHDVRLGVFLTECDRAEELIAKGDAEVARRREGLQR